MDMERGKLITVVVPVYNRAEIVMRTLASIKAQRSEDFSLVIVDNASTDNSAEVLAEWVNAHSDSSFMPKLLTESTPGASAARNCGLNAVTTPYVMFFDSDDEMRPTHIERIANHIKQFPETEILRWNTSTIDSDGWLITKDDHFHDEMQLHLMHSTLATQRFVVRTDIIKSVNGWNESLSTFDDVDMGVRLVGTGSKIRKLNGEPTVLMHHSEECISGNSYSERTEEMDQALTCIETYLTDAERAEDLRILNAKRAIVAAHLKRENNESASEKMLKKALNGVAAGDRKYIQAVYQTVKLFGKGGCFVALKLMGKKVEKR